MTNIEKFEQVFGFRPDENKNIYCESWWQENYHSPVRYDGKNHKCGECAYLNLNIKTSVGYKCERPNSRGKLFSSYFKYKHTFACKDFKERENGK